MHWLQRMQKICREHFLVCLCAGALCLPVSLTARLDAAQASFTVPSVLVENAGLPPIEIAFHLGNASIASGLEIKESDDVYPASGVHYPAGFDRQSPIVDLVNAFNAQHRDYRATLMDGVFVVRPVEGLANDLDSASATQTAVTVVGVMAAARRIFTPRLVGPAINSLGYEGEDIPVILNGLGHTVIDTLNQIVAQSPRTWVVTTRMDGKTVRIISFGFIHEHGARRTARVV